jgi:hypothetical protein
MKEMLLSMGRVENRGNGGCVWPSGLEIKYTRNDRIVLTKKALVLGNFDVCEKSVFGD